MTLFSSVSEVLCNLDCFQKTGRAKHGLWNLRLKNDFDEDFGKELMFGFIYHKQISEGKCVSVSKLIALVSLVSLVLIIGSLDSEASSGTYEVTIPEEWQPHISVDELIVDSNAFYGVPWFLGLYPVVRLNLPLENLTSDTLYLKLNYRTESKKRGYGNSGMGVCYTLGPREKRLIDTIVPIASVTRPIRFMIRMGEPLRSLDRKASAGTKIVTIDPFKISKAAIKDIELTNVDNEDFEVKEVRLVYSKEQGNHVIFKVQNKTNIDLRLEAYVAVNDPENIETKGVLARPRGFFSDSVETIPAKNMTSISISYNIPPIGPNPVLVYTLFEPRDDSLRLGERDSRKWDMMLVGYGSFNLNQAAERKECVIPVHAPVEERAKLTKQRNSEHFLFRYRPGSYAEQNIDKAISEREEAYEKLSKVLQMELPVIVTIDLYPDMEAKALGSGTKWTPANTRSNKHICEVYNQAYQCDPYHELAHIFSYHFQNYSSNRGGIVEAFAAYFEPNNFQIDRVRETLQQKLREGKLSSLDKVLQSDSSGEELVMVIDFLLKKDIEKFKKFYVCVTRSQKRANLEKASQEIYGTDLKGLEKQWHEYINQSKDI